MISKGRWKTPLTARFLARDRVPFRIAVEPQEADDYRRSMERIGVDPDDVVVLPFSNLGQGSIPARNWCLDEAVTFGHDRHWILDDNIQVVRRLYHGRRIPANAGPALRSVEILSDRYENVGVSGLNYQMFGVPGSPPYRTNVHVYSCILVNHAAPIRWRGRYNEDTDLCLQALTQGWATILANVFLADKQRTMSMGGGNEDLYAGDGRLEMARALERQWPGIASVRKRYGRVTHFVDWTRFADEPKLRLRSGVDLDALPPYDELGLELRAVSKIRSPGIRRLLDLYQQETASPQA